MGNDTNNTTGLTHKLKVLAKSSETVRITIIDEHTDKYSCDIYIGRLRRSSANIFTIYEKGKLARRIIPKNVQSMSLMGIIWKRK